jgi:inosine/xanthosine triphosphate pyrophosphatase family protein
MNNGSLSGADTPRVRRDRHALFVQRKRARSVVIEPSIVDDGDGFPVRSVGAEPGSIAAWIVPQMAVERLDDESAAQRVLAALEKRPDQGRRDKFVGVGTPEEVVAVVLPRDVPQLPARLLADV